MGSYGVLARPGRGARRCAAWPVSSLPAPSPSVGGRQRRPPSPLTPSVVVEVSARAARASGTANARRRVGSSPACAVALAPKRPSVRRARVAATKPASRIARRRPCALRANLCSATRRRAASAGRRTSVRVARPARPTAAPEGAPPVRTVRRVRSARPTVPPTVPPATKPARRISALTPAGLGVMTPRHPRSARPGCRQRSTRRSDRATVFGWT
jgi:hypothetical protein